MSDDHSLSFLKYAHVSPWNLQDFGVSSHGKSYRIVTSPPTLLTKDEIAFGHIVVEPAHSAESDIVIVHNVAGSGSSRNLMITTKRDLVRNEVAKTRLFGPVTAWPSDRNTRWRRYAELMGMTYADPQIEARGQSTETRPKLRRRRTYHFRRLPSKPEHIVSAKEAVQVVVEIQKTESSQETTSFVPSRSLVDFWIRGVEAHRAAAQRPGQEDQHRAFLGKQTAQNFQTAFAVRFKRMLSVVANRHRYGIADYRILGKDGRFNLPLQYQILDRVQIRPDESTEFFALLFEEISAFLRRGGRISGSWGELTYQQDGSIELVVRPRKTLEASQRELAEILE